MVGAASLEHWQTLDLLFRGVAVGAQLGLGISLARSADDRGLRIATLLFVISNICFTLNGARAIKQMLGPVEPLLWLTQIGSAGYFWLFAVTLFEDRRLSGASAAPPVVLTMIGLLGQYGPRMIAPWVWTIHNLLGLLLALNALVVIVRSGRNDLVEARRRLRVPFLVLIASFSIVLSVAQIGQNLGITAAWYEFANASIQALLGIAGVAVLLEARSTIFGVAGGGRPDMADISPIDDSGTWLERLHHVMEVDALWRREGLTIGQFAESVGLPEHRLRRLINAQLGHRNFASFINQRRIAEARTVLKDPASAAKTVASIAFDLGFGSLGPFNRAFRDETGLTPTEYRRLKLSVGSPILENSR